MKNLHLLLTILTVFIFSCSSDDDNNSTTPVAENQGISAIINGSTFNNYNFSDSIYQLTKGTNNTMTLNAGDTDGNQITLFLNSTGGFNSGTIKNMGDIDSNNFVTYILLRQNNPETSYFSSTGNLTITENRAHPTDSGLQLLSGSFEITANPVNDPTTITITGIFLELEFEN